MADTVVMQKTSFNYLRKFSELGDGGLRVARCCGHERDEADGLSRSLLGWQ